jgi:hypothetical protein
MRRGKQDGWLEIREVFRTFNADVRKNAQKREQKS